jgi:hypothetical protein
MLPWREGEGLELHEFQKCKSRKMIPQGLLDHLKEMEKTCFLHLGIRHFLLLMYPNNKTITQKEMKTRTYSKAKDLELQSYRNARLHPYQFNNNNFINQTASTTASFTNDTQKILSQQTPIKNLIHTINDTTDLPTIEIDVDHHKHKCIAHINNDTKRKKQESSTENIFTTACLLSEPNTHSDSNMELFSTEIGKSLANEKLSTAYTPCSITSFLTTLIDAFKYVGFHNIDNYLKCDDFVGCDTSQLPKMLNSILNSKNVGFTPKTIVTNTNLLPSTLKRKKKGPKK